MDSENNRANPAAKKSSASAAPRWRLASASSLGSSHHASGSPCQDAHGWDLLAQGQVLVLVACDGAGSASHSDVGAQLAVRTLLAQIGSFLQQQQSLDGISREVAKGWLATVSEALSQRAASDGVAVRQYACTLLAVIASPRQVCFVQVGDGAIVVRPAGSDNWQCLFWPQHGEYVNSTLFVTHPDAQTRFGFGVHAMEPLEIAVFTDGIESLALDLRGQTPHAPFFDWIFTPLRSFAHPGHSRELSLQLEASLASPLFCERTDDDKTLLLASRVPPVPPSPSQPVSDPDAATAQAAVPDATDFDLTDPDAQRVESVPPLMLPAAASSRASARAAAHYRRFSFWAVLAVVTIGLALGTIWLGGKVYERYQSAKIYKEQYIAEKRNADKALKDKNEAIKKANEAIKNENEALKREAAALAYAKAHRSFAEKVVERYKELTSGWRADDTKLKKAAADKAKEEKAEAAPKAAEGEKAMPNASSPPTTPQSRAPAPSSGESAAPPEVSMTTDATTGTTAKSKTTDTPPIVQGGKAPATKAPAAKTPAAKTPAAKAPATGDKHPTMNPSAPPVTLDSKSSSNQSTTALKRESGTATTAEVAQTVVPASSPSATNATSDADAAPLSGADSASRAGEEKEHKKEKRMYAVPAGQLCNQGSAGDAINAIAHLQEMIGKGDKQAETFMSRWENASGEERTVICREYGFLD